MASKASVVHVMYFHAEKTLVHIKNLGRSHAGHVPIIPVQANQSRQMIFRVSEETLSQKVKQRVIKDRRCPELTSDFYRSMQRWVHHAHTN